MNRKIETGLTLIELVVTIAIVGILTSIAVPSMKAMIHNNRMASHANELVSSLNLARSEAVKRGVSVMVTVKTAPNWHEGWDVWYLDGADRVVLKDTPTFDNNLELTSIEGVSEFTFGSAGTGSGNNPTDVNGRYKFDLCDPTTAAQAERRITVHPSGRVATSEHDC